MNKDKQKKMFSIIEEWGVSQQNIKTFCAVNNLKEATFHYWHRKYKALQEPEGKFIEVDIDPQFKESKDLIEIAYSNGTIIRVPAQSDLNLIRSLVNLQ